MLPLAKKHPWVTSENSCDAGLIHPCTSSLLSPRNLTTACAHHITPRPLPHPPPADTPRLLRTQACTKRPLAAHQSQHSSPPDFCDLEPVLSLLRILLLAFLYSLHFPVSRHIKEHILHGHIHKNRVLATATGHLSENSPHEAGRLKHRKPYTQSHPALVSRQW